MTRRRGARRGPRDDVHWLLHATNRMLRCRDVAALFDLAYDAIREGLDYDRVGLTLVDHERGVLVEQIGTDAHGRKFYPRGRALSLDADSYHGALLADPRMRGDGFIYRADATREMPSTLRNHLDGRPSQNMLVALRTAETILGMISVDNLTSGRPVTPEEAPPLVAFANALATALENIILLEGRARRIDHLDADLRQRIAQLEWLRETSRRITAARTIEDVLDVVYDGIRETLGFDRVGIILFDHERGLWEERRGTDEQGHKMCPTDRVQTLAPESPIWRLPDIAALLRGAEFYYTDDAHAETPPDLRHLLDGAPDQQLTVPLRAGQKVAGMICVDNLLTGKPVPRDEAGPLLALANQVATAVENARLLEREHIERARLEALLESARALNSTLDRDCILHELAGRLLIALNARGAAFTHVDVAARQITSLAARTAEGRPSIFIGGTAPLDDYPIFAQVLHTREPFIGHLDDGALPENERAYLRRWGLTAELLVPVVVQGVAMGVLDIYWDEPLTIGADMVTLCTAIAEQAAVALDNNRLYQDLRASEERFRALSEHATDLVRLIDRAGTILYASPSHQRMLGYAPHDMEGCKSTDFIHPDDRTRVRALLRAASRRPGVVDVGAFRLRHADGSWRWLEVTANNRLDDPAIQGIIVNANDVTDRVAMEETLRRQALHDALTGLPNRLLLQDRLRQALLAARRGHAPLALLLLDLDRFKEINDTFGHHHGDLLLRQVATRLQAALRATDTVARLGGDEFAVLLPGSDREGAITAAGKIAALLDRPLSIEGQSLRVGVSIGIALCPDHGAEAEALLRRADVAMYVAKRGGAAYAVYAPEQDTNTPARLALIADLRDAIARRELALHYQPIMALATDTIRGVEALARWPHPTLGLLSPDQFIPLAEQTGLIGPLTTCVLELALRQCRRWRRAGLALDMAVNLSMMNLRDPRLVESIFDLLRRCRVPASALCLEMTESMIMADPVCTREALERLTARGVRIAIDDFGTGYSSLASLKRLPVERLKIDKSFVQQMAEDETDAAIVTSTVGLAHSLGLRVVAEGVEDGETRERLARMGCDDAQGYYWSRPLPAIALEECLRAARRVA